MAKEISLRCDLTVTSIGIGLKLPQVSLTGIARFTPLRLCDSNSNSVIKEQKKDTVWASGRAVLKSFQPLADDWNIFLGFDTPTTFEKIVLAGEILSSAKVPNWFQLITACLHVIEFHKCSPLSVSHCTKVKSLDNLTTKSGTLTARRMKHAPLTHSRFAICN